MSIKKEFAKAILKSKAMLGGLGVGTIGVLLGLFGFDVNGSDLTYLLQAIPALIGATGILFLRVKNYTNSLDHSGWLALALAFFGTGVGALPQDILDQWGLVQTQFPSVVGVLFTVLAGFGLHYAKKPIKGELL